MNYANKTYLYLHTTAQTKLRIRLPFPYEDGIRKIQIFSSGFQDRFRPLYGLISWKYIELNRIFFVLSPKNYVKKITIIITATKKTVYII